MRIDRLDLIAFGPFTGAVLDFSGGAEGLHLVYGPNEAGKSSALRAIHQLFRGIPPQSTDNFVHKHAEMRVGALLRGRAGEALEIVRRKGAKNTLLGADGKAIDDPDAQLARMLGGVGAEEFLKKFVIDHAELIGGGKTVAEGGGDLGRVLFAAGSGLAGLGAVQKRLDDEAESLFKRGGSKPVINAKLAELDAARKRLKDDSLRSSEWREHDEAYRSALARDEALLGDLDSAVRERTRLHNLSEALGPIARRSAVLEELRDLADAPRLADGFTFRRRDAESRVVPNERFALDAEAKIRDLNEELERLDVPDALLEQADAIEALQLRLGGRQKDRQERERLDAERARFESEARAILRDLGRGPGEPGSLEALRLKGPDRAAVHDLANERQALLQARDETAKVLQAHDARSKTVAAELAALGPARDIAPLRTALKKAQKPGDLDDLLRADREALGRERRKADVALKALGFWSGTLDALETLPVPQPERLDRFEAEFSTANAEHDDLRRRLVECEADLRTKESEIEQFRLDGGVPTEDALAAARDARESAWERLKNDGWGAHHVAPYERSVRDADDAADRLRREARRVGDHARLLAERSRLAATLDDLRARLTQSETRLDDLRTRWAALWAALGIAAPGTPREMIAWSRAAASVAALAGSVREKAEAVDRREEQFDRHRRELLDALGESEGDTLADPNASNKTPPLAKGGSGGVLFPAVWAGSEPPSIPPPRGGKPEMIDTLIDRAQELIDAVAKESKTRDKLKDELETLNGGRADRVEAAESSQDAWGAWQARWAAAMARIGREPDVLPSEANAVLNLNADLFDRLDKAEEHRLRVEAIAREGGQFASDVWALADRVAPDLAVGKFDATAAEAAAAELSDRLTRARAAKQSRDSLTAQLAEKALARDAARAEVARARAELAALRREARCDSDDDLPAVEERSARRQRLEKERADLNAALVKLAAGTPLETFLAEAAQADPSGLAPRIARLDERIAELERERATVNQTIGEERGRLSQMDGSARAADAGQDAEDLRARIKSDVDQYARLRLASAVLRAGIERYRNKSQGPVLARASSLFSALTLGSFDGLTVDYDDRDDPVLKGVRPGTREPIGVFAMSLGTADQLYLALRLATLETYLDRREPLPLVVDDILIQFDNARTSATLSALATLSRRTQVLVFTHHEHLRELASKVVPADVLFTHELAGPVTAPAPSVPPD